MRYVRKVVFSALMVAAVLFFAVQQAYALVQPIEPPTPQRRPQRELYAVKIEASGTAINLRRRLTRPADLIFEGVAEGLPFINYTEPSLGARLLRGRGAACVKVGEEEYKLDARVAVHWNRVIIYGESNETILSGVGFLKSDGELTLRATLVVKRKEEEPIIIPLKPMAPRRAAAEVWLLNLVGKIKVSPVLKPQGEAPNTFT